MNDETKSTSQATELGKELAAIHRYKGAYLLRLAARLVLIGAAVFALSHSPLAAALLPWMTKLARS